MKYTLKQLAKFIDHTNLKPYASTEDMKLLCNQAKEYGFCMVAINSVQSKACSEFLAGTDVHTGAAIGFPLGQTTIESKVFETENAIANGANEIDYMINITAVKDGDYDYIEEEMRRIVAVCKKHQVISKVIFENCYLEKEEIKKISEIALNVLPDFIKTSTGFGTGGATIEDVTLMKSVVGDAVQVKAAGGIRDKATFIQMIQAGASRIGTSSGMQIIDDLTNELQVKNSLELEI